MKDQKKDIIWFRRYLDGLYTKEDVEQLSNYFRQENPNNEQTALDTDLWEESAHKSPTDNTEMKRYKAEAHQLLTRLKQPRPKRFLFRPFLKIAVIICIMCGSIVGWQYWRNNHITYLTVTTNIAEQQEVTLPDGTRLMLNACSRITYPERFVGNTRTIELEGEGFFDVARNEKHPFRIITQRMEITVLGTCFNAKSYPEDELISVDVESGKVEVTIPEATLRLQANEQLIADTQSGEFYKQHITHQIGTWRNGFLSFNNTPIRDVAKELERIYGCRITFAKEDEFNSRISGEHDNNSLESVLQSIEFTTGIHYKREGDHIHFYKE